jgi:hypothetical protein
VGIADRTPNFRGFVRSGGDNAAPSRAADHDRFSDEGRVLDPFYGDKEAVQIDMCDILFQINSRTPF